MKMILEERFPNMTNIGNGQRANSFAIDGDYYEIYETNIAQLYHCVWGKYF